MNDLERIKKVIESLEKNPGAYNCDLESIVGAYITTYPREFSLERLFLFAHTINDKYVKSRISLNDYYVNVAKEKAGYVDMYLKGNMYVNEEVAKEHLPLQSDHASQVVNYLKKYN